MGVRIANATATIPLDPRGLGRDGARPAHKGNGGRPQPQVPHLKVEKYTLPNGLEVILHEDHTTPVVGVNLWYKVGSKNEKAGRTGFAHLFEHLMFQGSKHHDNEYFGPIEKVGRRDQRQHQHRPHQLLRERAQQRAWSWPSGSSPTGWASSCRP